MSVDTTMAVLYAQSGLSNNANAAMVAPQASLAMTRVLAAEQARQERQQVEKSDKTEKGNIQPDKDGRKGFFHSRSRSRRAKRESEEIAETGDLPVTPIIGNLLNVKV